jgi:hypothetical protein
MARNTSMAIPRVRERRPGGQVSWFRGEKLFITKREYPQMTQMAADLHLEKTFLKSKTAGLPLSALICVHLRMNNYLSRSASTKSIDPSIVIRSATSHPRLINGNACMWAKEGVRMRIR